MRVRTVLAVGVTLSLAGGSNAMAYWWCRDVDHSLWEQPFVKKFPDPLSLTVGTIDDDERVIQIGPVLGNQFGYWVEVARPTFAGSRRLGWVRNRYLYPEGYWCHS